MSSIRDKHKKSREGVNPNNPNNPNNYRGFGRPRPEPSDNEHNNDSINNRFISSQMLAEMRAGDQKAFETVYLHYASSVKNFLTTLMRSHDLGEELTQEVFVVLWENREKIDPDKNVSGYIYIIARNIAFKHFRRHKNIFNEDAAVVDNINDVTPHEVLISKEIELLIDIAIGMMPAQRREIFIMSRKQGLNNSEIAEKLQISKNTVENQLTSALKYLKTMISLFFAIILS